jgi:hypothetical protein
LGEGDVGISLGVIIIDLIERIVLPIKQRVGGWKFDEPAPPPDEKTRRSLFQKGFENAARNFGEWWEENAKRIFPSPKFVVLL